MEQYEMPSLASAALLDRDFLHNCYCNGINSIVEKSKRLDAEIEKLLKYMSAVELLEKNELDEFEGDGPDGSNEPEVSFCFYCGKEVDPFVPHECSAQASLLL